MNCRKLTLLLLAFCAGFAPAYAKQNSDVKFNSRHYVTGELGLGYSALMHNVPDAQWKGSAGAIGQVGYEWKYKKFLLHTGLELSSINSLSAVNDRTLQIDYTYSDNVVSGAKMRETFAFSGYREQQAMGLLNIPVMAGARFDNFYFLAGAKIGIGLWGTASSKAMLNTTNEDLGLIGEMHNMPDRQFFEGPVSSRNRFALSIPDAQLSAEIGWYLDDYMPKNWRVQPWTRDKKPISYRLSLFADYGLTNCIGSPASFADMVTVGYPREVGMQSMYNAYPAKANSLLVGAKFAVLFQVSKEPKKKPAASWLMLTATDEATGRPTAVNVAMKNMRTGRMTIKGKALGKGSLKQKVAKGDYELTVSKRDYYPQTHTFSIVDMGDTVTLNVAMRHRPWLRLFVSNAETGEAIPVVANVLQQGKDAPVAALHTDTVSGTARVMLPDGEGYSLRIEQLGYEAWSAPIASIGDSLAIRLTPIKKGRVIVLHNLFFATNKTRILPESEEALNDLYLFMNENPQVRIRIIGHTDNVGSDEANQKLSEGRANAVKDDIVGRGIDTQRIETIGKGESEPVASNDTEEGRAQNRRVEFVIL